jgi:dTDP-4-amino-4,6-dideoxygalactose transaminase
MTEAITFIDLAAQRRRLANDLQAAMQRVMDRDTYIMGREVSELEAELAEFCGARYVVSCANGTDALELVLIAMGIGPGSAIFCPTFTFCATAEAIASVGATPIFVDVVPDTFNMNPTNFEVAITVARQKGLRPTAVIPVDLFGLPADYDALEQIATREALWILCDAAQSFGAHYKKRKVGGIGLASITSFYPTKPFGCYGDGGAIFTDDPDLAEKLRALRMHGQGTDKYDNVLVGRNSRLDTIQAAVLIEKLKIFPEEIERRNYLANRYSDLLCDQVITQVLPEGLKSVWAHYTLRLPFSDRTSFIAALKSEGVPTAIYYPKPLHLQPAYANYRIPELELPIAERLSTQVLSLPMHAYMSDAIQDRVVIAVNKAAGDEAAERTAR